MTKLGNPSHTIKIETPDSNEWFWLHWDYTNLGTERETSPEIITTFIQSSGLRPSFHDVLHLKSVQLQVHLHHLTPSPIYILNFCILRCITALLTSLLLYTPFFHIYFTLLTSNPFILILTWHISSFPINSLKNFLLLLQTLSFDTSFPHRPSSCTYSPPFKIAYSSLRF